MMLTTESAEVAAKRVTYDIRFRVIIPGIGSVGMIINVEAQNKFYEKYDLVSRGVFYCARMLSAQVRNEEAAVRFDGDGYGMPGPTGNSRERNGVTPAVDYGSIRETDTGRKEERNAREV